MNKLLEPSHPFWLIGITLTVGLVMWLNASTFDHTELTAWAQFTGLLIGAEGIRRKLTAAKGNTQ